MSSLIWSKAMSIVLSCGMTEAAMAQAQNNPAGSIHLSSPDFSSDRILNFKFSADLTRDQAIALWGQPVPDGPDGQIEAFHVYGDRTLWLSFTADRPGRLTRAILLESRISTDSTELFNNLPITKERRASQLDLSSSLRVSDISAAWGPADALTGSGLQIWIYKMADGGRAAVSASGGMVGYVRFEGAGTSPPK